MIKKCHLKLLFGKKDVEILIILHVHVLTESDNETFLNCCKGIYIMYKTFN